MWQDKKRITVQPALSGCILRMAVLSVLYGGRQDPGMNLFLP